LLGYKAEHVVDMDSGAVVAAEIHAADQGDTATMLASLELARTNIAAAKSEDSNEPGGPDDDDDAPGSASTEPTVEVVADKGYHKAELLYELKARNYRTYVSVPKPPKNQHWRDRGSHYGEATAEVGGLLELADRRVQRCGPGCAIRSSNQRLPRLP
jgi:hypothetical protein